MDDKLLIIYMSIGNEDGPSFGCLLEDYKDYKNVIPRSNILVVNLDDKKFNTDKARDFNCNSDTLKFLFSQFRIVGILEIHDWYDYLNQREVIEKQKYFDTTYVNDYMPEYNELVSFITVIPYNQNPIKYLIPHYSDVYKYISSNLNIFDKENGHVHEQKQNLADIMRPYIVHASYNKIMKSDQKLVDHTIVLSDEIENPIIFE